MGDIVRDAVIVAAGEGLYRPLALKWNIPWYVVALIHLMEAGHEDDPWERGIHNGLPWYEPNSYIPGLQAFESWKDSANHAIGTRVAEASRWEPWNISDVSRFLDEWNGCWKYQRYHVNSPYLYAASNHGHGVGKYKRVVIGEDGSQQLLCCCRIKEDCPHHHRLTNNMRIACVYMQNCHQEQCGTITVLHYMLQQGMVGYLDR